MKPRRIKNLINLFLLGDCAYTNWIHRISRTEIIEFEKELDIQLQIEHTYGASAGPIAVYPLKKNDFRVKAEAYLNRAQVGVELDCKEGEKHE